MGLEIPEPHLSSLHDGSSQRPLGREENISIGSEISGLWRFTVVLPIYFDAWMSTGSFVRAGHHNAYASRGCYFQGVLLGLL